MDMNQLNDEQKAVFKQFRASVQDCQLPESDDTYLLRWLVARNFDLAKAENMLRNSLDWRRKYKVDLLNDGYQSPEVLTKYFAAGHLGVDKFKSNLLLIRYGMIDIKGVLLSSKKKDYVMHVVQIVEKTLAMFRKDPMKYKRSPDAISQASVIVDLEGFSMNHVTFKPALDTAIQLVQMYESNYPELLRRVFIINAPKIFSILYSIVLPFMHERTRNKIQIFSHDAKQWKAALLADIDPDQLPASYGGTMTDPDGNPNCITKVNMGGVVPNSYYFNCKPDTRNKKPLSISRGSKEQLEFQVNQAATVLRWDFHSEDSDIAFAVYRKQGSELIPVVPYDRVDCDLSAEEGAIDCYDTGVYIVEFDNSFSYFRSKKIWYSITIE
ncbi:SEC14-like protein 2 [Daphnia pulicaria]|uniref:SEC14-like protein 2 n=1 Tax=Daphnia pulicaria TaxID=35523 RepID=UPI001EEAED96|nr:SEC14-like protein 2 [Daphnia pulicaria]